MVFAARYVHGSANDDWVTEWPNPGLKNVYIRMIYNNHLLVDVLREEECDNGSIGRVEIIGIISESSVETNLHLKKII